MRVPLSWLSTHVDIDGVPLQTLDDELTTAGAEIEATELQGVHHPDCVVGVILEGGPLADKPGVAHFSVDVGRDAPLSLVTKAPNLQGAAPGTKVALALPGVPIFTNKKDALALVTVQSRETYGKPSEGVGCSSFELGIADDHGGVLVLETDAAAGTPVRDAVALDEHTFAERVLTLAILPNIARCQSVIGVAREVGAIRSARFDPAVAEADLAVGSGSDLDPSSTDATICDRFGVALLQGVSVGPSPLWMQKRLVAIGQQPINNVVDASNYVMMELGQPTHAYDADSLPSLQLHVRPSTEGEAFKPLVAEDDAEPSVLPAGLPLITSGGVAVAQAGVMGGFETQVTGGTTRILLESAHFDAIAIRKSQAATLTFSESSARFSRGTDPAGVERALRRIVALLKETCPDLVVEKTGLYAPCPLPERQISLAVGPMNAALGLSVSPARARELLERAGFGVQASGDTLTVSVPTFRGDVEGAHDLHEEVARLHGFDRMPSTMPVEPVPQRPQPRDYLLRRAVEDQLAAAGLQQCLSYSLTAQPVEDRLFAGEEAVPERAYTTLKNPSTEDRAVLRRTLLGHLVEYVRDNRRHASRVHLYEVGPVFHPERSVDPDGLPLEPLHLGLVMWGPREPGSLHGSKEQAVDFFDVVTVLEDVLGHFHPGVLVRSRASVSPFHPGVCAALSVQGPADDAPVLLGHLGELHPSVATAFDLEGERVFAAELDLGPVFARATDTFPAPGPARFPGIELDISVLVADTVEAGALVDAAHGAGASLLSRVTVFDVYAGKGVEPGHQAVGLRLLFADSARTLRMEEAEAARSEVVSALARGFGATLRG